MTPDDLRAYLEAVKASGLAVSRLSVPMSDGALVVEVGAAAEHAAQPAQPVPQVMRDLEELFPNGIRPGS